MHELSLILEGMRARGPDSQNIKKCSPLAALAGARLRITDATNALADLPMTSHCGRYTAVLNGQIYNHHELRQSLGPQNFRTQCDTETLIEAFRKWGPSCVERFEGMFAYAIFDQQDQTLYLARDPAGQKPLYYIQDKNGFVFASDIKTLIADPYRTKTLSPQALAEFVSQRMITGNDTQYQEIRKLPGGQMLSITAQGKLNIGSYYSLPFDEQKFTDPADIMVDIHQQIDRAVAETASIEHPASLLLSGGIDSTGLLALLQKHGVMPRTYSIGFTPFSGDTFGLSSVFNEFEHSRMVAAHYGTDHVELSLSKNDYLDAITGWARMMGDPVDATEAPLLHHLFKQIRADGIRLTFAGSGPDEIFDGYGHGSALVGIPPSELAAAYSDRFSWAFAADFNRLMPDHFAASRQHTIAKMNTTLAPYLNEAQDSVQLTQTINFHGRLQSYEFYEMDMTSSSQGIESRSPLIARNVIRSAFSFPSQWKRHNNTPKWIYKESWRGVIPDSIIDRPKSGFETPIAFWFSEEYETAVQDVLFSTNSPLHACGIFDTVYLRECWDKRDPSHRAIFYRLFCLALMLNEQSSLNSSALLPSYRLSA